MRIFLCALLAWPMFLSGQYDFVRNGEVSVSQDGVELISAWAGGINSGQLSRIDLNDDGKMDLFVFDRVGNRVLTFLNTDDSEGQIHYTHTFDYNEDFPTMKNWALLRDFNCDGKADIFTSKSSAFQIYENVGDGEPEFNVRWDAAEAEYNFGSPFSAPMYCISPDIPSIVDYDDDGDMDIFSWTETSTTVYYYKSMAQELGNCDSLAYETKNRCYGKFREGSEDASIFYGEDFECDFNVVDPEVTNDETRSGLHAGGVLLSIDVDQNGIKDLMSSDVTMIGMNALIMEECPDGQDSVVFVHEDFPAPFDGTVALELRTFPGGFYEDIDNDGVKDLVCSPNATVDTEDDYSMWYYRNNGENDNPDFEKVRENLLQGDMMDFGRGAYPKPVDIDGDGLMDLVVSNKEYNEAVDWHPSQLALLLNVGTAEEPAFELADTNYLDLPQYGVESTCPAFGDLDNDGDYDMILGEEGGIMHFFRNTAGEGNVAQFQLEIPNMSDSEGNSLDVGQFATPQLFDVNDDGTLDLLVGEKNGNINYIENVGTPEEFSFTHMIDTIGGVIASNFLGINGYSVPFMWKDEDGALQLITGSEVGPLNHYDDIDGENLDEDFTLVEEYFGGIWEGTRSAACLYDFNDDSLIDVVYGQIGGGLAFYEGGDGSDYIAGSDIEIDFVMYPNPSNGLVQIQMKDGGLARKQINVYNNIGQKVTTQVTSRRELIQLDLQHLAQGAYVVEVRMMNRTKSQLLLIE